MSIKKFTSYDDDSEFCPICGEEICTPLYYWDGYDDGDRGCVAGCEECLSSVYDKDMNEVVGKCPHCGKKAILIAHNQKIIGCERCIVMI